MRDSPEWKKIYNKLEDEQSKHIFLNRHHWNETNDIRYLLAENNEKIINILLNVNQDIPVIIYGTGSYADYAFYIFSKFLHITCYCIGVNGEKRVYNNLPVISVDELVANYKNSIVLFLPDNFSLRIFYYLLRFGFNRERLITFTPKGTEYFDLPCFIPEENEVFVDAGSYDGDTVMKFLKWCNHRYKRIYALEPDSKSFEMLQKRLKENI